MKSLTAKVKFLKNCKKNSSDNKIIMEERQSLSPSERLRQARACNKRVSFLEFEHVLEPSREYEDEGDNILRSVEEVGDVALVTDELANTKVKFTLPEPPLSSENEGSSSANVTSVTNEYLIGVVEDDEDLTDSQTSAPERAFGSRKTKNRSKMVHVEFEEFVSNIKPSKKQPAEVYSIGLGR